MTATQFRSLCEGYLISPEIALENPAVADALADRDDKRVRELIENEF